MDKLAVYWEQAKDATTLVLAFLERAKNAPMEIWEGSAGQAGTRLFIVLVLIGVAFGLVALVVNFFKESWRGKLHILFVLVLAVMILGVILWYGLKDAEAAALPEAGAVTAGEVKALSYPQYTLDHDAENAYWKLTDDIFTVQAGSELVVQLAGLHDVDGQDFSINYFWRDGDRIAVGLAHEESFGSALGDIRYSSTYTPVELQVRPGESLTAQPWYGAAGEIRTEGDASYTILESDGERTVFLVEDGWRTTDDEPMRGVCVARQEGPDVLWVTLRTSTTQVDYHADSNEQDSEAVPYCVDYDPASDDALRARMQTTATELLDRNLVLLSGLTDEERAAVLPERVSVPGDTEGRGFAVPCEELAELGGGETDQFIRFYGADADGNRVLYTLKNGGVMLMNDRVAEYEAWEASYKAGKSEPDDAMSAFLGAAAVPWEGGWLLNPGAFIRRMISQENYCFLVME